MTLHNTDTKAAAFRKVMAVVRDLSCDEREMIRAAKYYGAILWRNHVGIYRDDFYEDLIFARCNGLSIAPVSTKPVLHVISEAYATGGHTRLLERLHAFSPDQSDVLITLPTTDASALRGAAGAAAIFSERGFSIEELAAFMGGSECVCLHIHPDDIGAAVAARIARHRFGTRVIFVNHADHVFSFGYAAADVIAEISGFGLAKSRCYGRGASVFMGLPLPVQEFFPVRPPQTHQVFSAASSLKFKPAVNVSFPAFVRKLLRADSRVTFLLIGPRHSDPWWKDLLGEFPGRLFLEPALQYDDYLARIKNASVYVDSFPMTGGTALPEVRAMGIAVAGLHVGAEGYTPLDVVRDQDDDALVSSIVRFLDTADGPILERNNDPHLLKDLHEAHHPSRVKERFLAILAGESSLDYVPTHEGDPDFFEKKWSYSGLQLTKEELIWLCVGSSKAGISCWWRLFRLLDGKGRRRMLSITIMAFWSRLGALFN